MDPALEIRNAVSGVNALRQTADNNPDLALAVRAVKRFQQRRFSATYQDLLTDARYLGATRFFLTELYGDSSYVERDTQFARVAGAMQRLLPDPAIETAVSLARLHGLSEQLDHNMGLAWLAVDQSTASSDTLRYVRAWRTTGERTRRIEQLTRVIEIGRDLDRLTRTRGLRVMLRAMRGPAGVAGLLSLQRFLERGFDAFASMGKVDRGAKSFLEHIRQREEQLMATLFDAPLNECVRQLQETMACTPEPTGSK